jgi:hypothetical protein
LACGRAEGASAPGCQKDGELGELVHGHVTLVQGTRPWPGTAWPS